MPTYDYACDGCGYQFERFQSFREEPLKTCPTCGQDQLRRLLGTGAAILFKGSGFYQTDYRSESYQAAAKAEVSASSSSSSNGSSATSNSSTASTISDSGKKT